MNKKENEIYSGSYGGTILLWDLSTKKINGSLKGHLTCCNCINISDTDSNYIVSGSVDTNVKIWDLRARLCMNTFKAHNDEITCVEFSPDNKYIASGCADGTVKIWDLIAGKYYAGLDFLETSISCLNFNPLYSSIAIGTTNKTIKYYELETFDNIFTTTVETAAVSTMTFHPDGKYLYTGSSDIKVWNLSEGKMLDALQVPPKTISDLKISEDNFLLALNFYRNTLSVWSIPIEDINFNPTVEVYTPISDYIQRGASNFKESVASIDKLKEENSNRKINKSVNLSQKSTIKRNKYKSDTSVFRYNGLNIAQSAQNFYPPLLTITKLEEFSKQKTPKYEATDHSFPTIISDESKSEILSPISESDKMSSITQVSRFSIVPMKFDKPVNLNFNDFLPGEDDKNDLDIIKEINKHHPAIINVAERRLNNMKMIMKWWNTNNYASAINAMNMLSDVSVICDIFRQTFSDNNRLDILSLDNCVNVINHASSLINSKYEPYLNVGLKTIENIFNYISEKLMNSYSNFNNDSIIDVVREERRNKAEECITSIKKIIYSNGFKKATNRNTETGELSRKILIDIEFFINAIEKKSNIN